MSSPTAWVDTKKAKERALWQKGISRRHAKINRKGSELFLKDLGSVNGTLLSGRRLTPYLPHALSDKGEIRMGKLLMRVHSI